MYAMIERCLTSVLFMRAPWLVGALVASPNAGAHLVGGSGPGAAFNPWAVDPAALVLLLLTAWFYWRGTHKLPRRTGATARLARRRKTYFWSGWWVLVAVLVSPIDPLGEVLFFVHMLQHELMMLVAGPLLVASRPSAALLRGMPDAGARSIGRLLSTGFSRGVNTWLLAPASAWCLHTVGLWGWHAPALFEAGLRSTGIHALQHVTFLVIALIFWFAIMRRRDSGLVAVLYLFTTAIHASLLGALLTFSPDVWYPTYAETAPEWGLTGLEDQQLGGLIMWMPAGIVFVAGGLMALAQTMRHSERLQPAARSFTADKVDGEPRL